MKKFVIHPDNFPTRPPILGTILWWLFLDRLHVGHAAWGAFWTLVGLVWLVAIYCMFEQKLVRLQELGGSRER